MAPRKRPTMAARDFIVQFGDDKPKPAADFLYKYDGSQRLAEILDVLKSRGERAESVVIRVGPDSSVEVRLASASSERSYGATEQRAMSNPAGLGGVVTVGARHTRDILAEPDGPFANLAQGEATGPNLQPGAGTLADVQAGGDE